MKVISYIGGLSTLNLIALAVNVGRVAVLESDL
jgi:hypothetical protein